MLEALRGRLTALPRRWKRIILIGFDTIALMLALWASFSLRLGHWAMPATLEEVALIVMAPVLAVPVFARMGLYRAVVRYLPERAIWTMIKSVTLAVLLWVAFAFLARIGWQMMSPRSVPVIYWALATILVIGSRLAAKSIFVPARQPSGSARPAVAIYGAGETGAQLARSLADSYAVAGFLDDNPALHRREVAGLRVYPPTQLPMLVENNDVNQVILSIPSLTATRRREIVSAISRHGVTVRSLPHMKDIVAGWHLVSQVRDIEIGDLLGRSSVPADPELIQSMIVGRTIMVTGAGGSIGSELCRKIAELRPQRLILFEANEFALYRIEKELADLYDVTAIAVLGSVADPDRVSRTISNYGVEAIFHTAAYKHVPLVESNVVEGVRNNIFGTLTVAESARRLGVRHFVLISTDKAVRPTNVMGATKRWAELIVRQQAAQASVQAAGQRFCSVRFGNVLGTNGSVVPRFKEQIARGGPVTLTDPAMTRYFMSAQEAAELIIQAGALSESGDIFLLDMGEPIRIADLAESMINLGGLTVRSAGNPQGDIEIVVTGKKPGEKLFEELFYDASRAERTRHPKILRVRSIVTDGLEKALDDLREALRREDEAALRHMLFETAVRNDVPRRLASEA